MCVLTLPSPAVSLSTCRVVRELAAKALHNLTPLDALYMRDDGMYVCARVCIT